MCNVRPGTRQGVTLLDLSRARECGAAQISRCMCAHWPQKCSKSAGPKTRTVCVSMCKSQSIGTGHSGRKGQCEWEEVSSKFQDYEIMPS